jgi:tryptophan synthase alpha chain
VLGVTGSRDNLSDTVEGLVGKLKTLTSIPVCVGFGISKAEHAAAVAAAGADGVIIGSKIVALIEQNLKSKEKMLAEISTFLSDVKTAIERQSD